MLKYPYPYIGDFIFVIDRVYPIYVIFTNPIQDIIYKYTICFEKTFNDHIK